MGRLKRAQPCGSTHITAQAARASVSPWTITGSRTACRTWSSSTTGSIEAKLIDHASASPSPSWGRVRSVPRSARRSPLRASHSKRLDSPSERGVKMRAGAPRAMTRSCTRSASRVWPRSSTWSPSRATKPPQTRSSRRTPGPFPPSSSPQQQILASGASSDQISPRSPRLARKTPWPSRMVRRPHTALPATARMVEAASPLEAGPRGMTTPRASRSMPWAATMPSQKSRRSAVSSKSIPSPRTLPSTRTRSPTGARSCPLPRASTLRACPRADIERSPRTSTATSPRAKSRRGSISSKPAGTSAVAPSAAAVARSQSASTSRTRSPPSPEPPSPSRAQAGPSASSTSSPVRGAGPPSSEPASPTSGAGIRRRARMVRPRSSRRRPESSTLPLASPEAITTSGSASIRSAWRWPSGRSRRAGRSRLPSSRPRSLPKEIRRWPLARPRASIRLTPPSAVKERSAVSRFRSSSARAFRPPSPVTVISTPLAWGTRTRSGARRRVISSRAVTAISPPSSSGPSSRAGPPTSRRRKAGPSPSGGSGAASSSRPVRLQPPTFPAIPPVARIPDSSPAGVRRPRRRPRAVRRPSSSGRSSSIGPWKSKASPPSSSTCRGPRPLAVRRIGCWPSGSATPSSCAGAPLRCSSTLGRSSSSARRGRPLGSNSRVARPPR